MASSEVGLLILYPQAGKKNINGMTYFYTKKKNKYIKRLTCICAVQLQNNHSSVIGGA